MELEANPLRRITPVPPHLIRAIQSGDTALFYGSEEWRHAAKEARTAQHDECQRCKARGFYAACQAVHHKQHIRTAPELALTPENLECLCAQCHWDEHHPAPPLPEERW